MSRQRYYDEEDARYYNPEETELPTVEEKAEPATRTGKVANVTLLNMRREPRAGSGILEVLEKEDQVEILGEEKDFYKVRVGSGKEGYVMKKYIKEV